MQARRCRGTTQTYMLGTAVDTVKIDSWNAVSVVRLRPWAPFVFPAAELVGLFARICPIARSGGGRWDTRDEQVHALGGQPVTVGLASVKRGLLRAFPTVDRHELMLGSAVTGGNRCPCFAQAVCGAMG